MSDKELEDLKQRRLHELRRKIVLREQEKEPEDAHQILNKILKGRAWEVFNAAYVQFPNEMVKVEHLLLSLAMTGKINELEGEQLYDFLWKIGLHVRLNTTINFLSHGKRESLSDKFKEQMK